MSKQLVLAEKPSVARDIARVLNCQKKGNGYLEGKDYIVTWALGHLVTLADPEAYSEQYKSWNLDDLPIIPKPFKLVVIKKTSKQYKAVKEQMLRKDVNQIIVATDAGREGELVARWIIEKAGVKKPLKRLWISSVTDKAIKDGFKNLKDGKLYDALYKAATARSEADWIVGINATRALTTKYQAELSCGRVQTPTLAMIATREAEIRSFKSQTYYELELVTNGLVWTHQGGRIFNEEAANKVKASLNGKDALVMDVKKAQKKVYPPKLYDLTELQRDANQLFGFSPKETLSIMQKLYEQHKALTYPRTDSRYLTSDIVPTLGERLKAVAIGPYRKQANQLLGQTLQTKAVVNDQKVSDHHAIIPTEQTVLLTELSDRERKIFDLVVKRFFAALSKAALYEQTTMQAKVGEHIFVTKQNRLLEPGFKGEGAELGADVSHILQGATLESSHVRLTRGKTQPPAPFSEATLLSAMENPTPFIDAKNKHLAKKLTQTGGIGTVATRADIIEKLFGKFMMEKRGQDIHLTAKGRQLLELVPEDLKSPALTGEWEQKLTAIEQQKLNEKQFMAEMKAYAEASVSQIKSSETIYKHDNMTTTKCPECGKFMLSVKGKRGNMLVCQDRACKTKKVISQTTNSRCPNCHKKLELRGEGEKRMFTCVCGHRERLNNFQKRKQEQNKQGNKRDVQKYLREQNKQEEPLNSALADALAALKLK